MSLEGLLRLHLGGMFWTAVVLTLLWIGLGFLARAAARETGPESASSIRFVRRVLVVVIAVCVVISVADNLLTNVTPRAVIDRSEVKAQQEEHEKRVKRELEQQKPPAGQKEESR